MCWGGGGMRCFLASIRLGVGAAVIVLASANGAAEPKLCPGNLWYPGGVCPSEPPPASTEAPPPPPTPQGPTQAEKDEALRQQQIRAEQLRREAFTRAEDAGVNAYRRGDYAAAIQYFERALQYSPYNPTIKHDIQRAREKLAEQTAPAPAPANRCMGSCGSGAFDQLNAIANNSRAAVQAPPSHYSANLGGTGAPNRARGGFDAAVPVASIPLEFDLVSVSVCDR